MSISKRTAVAFAYARLTDLDIVDSAIHGVVCQKSDFHGKSDIQNSKKQKTRVKFRPK
jgi:hypothetical protein